MKAAGAALLKHGLHRLGYTSAPPSSPPHPHPHLSHRRPHWGVTGSTDDGPRRLMTPPRCRYVNMDCGWMGGRHANGTLYESATKFPHGLKALADWLHARG
eukprot:COSAG04_NODE_9385_length_868_cov_1.394018_1_plen_101_part_00